MTPVQTWTKQTANPFLSLADQISYMSTSSVSWSTYISIHKSLECGCVWPHHTISHFWIQAQILCPFSSPQLWSCEFPKTALHDSHLTSLASHPSYSHREQRERSHRKYDNSGHSRGGPWTDLQLVHIEFTHFNPLFLNFFWSVPSQLSLIQFFTCIWLFP